MTAVEGIVIEEEDKAIILVKVICSAQAAFPLTKNLKASIDFKYKPSMCPWSVAVARYVQAEEKENANEDESNINFED